MHLLSFVAIAHTKPGDLARLSCCELGLPTEFEFGSDVVAVVATRIANGLGNRKMNHFER